MEHKYVKFICHCDIHEWNKKRQGGRKFEHPAI